MVLVSLIIGSILIASDQIAKLAALRYLKPVGNMTAIQGFLDFTFVENRGAAFGIMEGKRLFFILVTIAIAVVLLYYFYKMPKNKEYNVARISFVLILAGAIGNLIDRLLRGYVVDFLEFTFIRWPVFNLADIYVVVGTAILVYAVLFLIKDEPVKKDSVS